MFITKISRRFVRHMGLTYTIVGVRGNLLMVKRDNQEWAYNGWAMFPVK